jgi:hypothetical protein
MREAAQAMPSRGLGTVGYWHDENSTRKLVQFGCKCMAVLENDDVPEEHEGEPRAQKAIVLGYDEREPACYIVAKLSDILKGGAVVVQRARNVKIKEKDQEKLLRDYEEFARRQDDDERDTTQSVTRPEDRSRKRSSTA